MESELESKTQYQTKHETKHETKYEAQCEGQSLTQINKHIETDQTVHTQYQNKQGPQNSNSPVESIPEKRLNLSMFECK